MPVENTSARSITTETEAKSARPTTVRIHAKGRVAASAGTRRGRREPYHARSQVTERDGLQRRHIVRRIYLAGGEERQAQESKPVHEQQGSDRSVKIDDFSRGRTYFCEEESVRSESHGKLNRDNEIRMHDVLLDSPRADDSLANRNLPDNL